MWSSYTGMGMNVKLKIFHKGKFGLILQFPRAYNTNISIILSQIKGCKIHWFCSLRARSICTFRRAKICVFTLLTFSILYNLPRWFEVITVVDDCISGIRNVTIYTNQKSELRDNEYYIKFYINWAYCIIMYIIPFGCLVIFNFAIYRQVSGSMVSFSKGAFFSNSFNHSMSVLNILHSLLLLSNGNRSLHLRSVVYSTKK
jgi:hypothetical protein